MLSVPGPHAGLPIIGWCAALVLLLGVGAAQAENAENAADTFRVLSWNISLDAFEDTPGEFRALVAWADPDIVLLDEVSPTADEGALRASLDGLRPENSAPWQINMGTSGGKQRAIVASRAAQQPLEEFTAIVPYPPADRRRVLDRVPDDLLDRVTESMDAGIPVNGALITLGARRLLVVVVDLACCGDGPESWEEARRRIEAREIRGLIRQVLTREAVDGLILAGDFNLVNSTFPMALFTGPYPEPHGGIIPAELYHPDGLSSWTWDGRGTPFASNTLDYQFYGPGGLRQHAGFILEPEGLAPEILQAQGLTPEGVAKTGRHRPLLVEYRW